MKLWNWLATKVGDLWITWQALAVWPYPAVIVGVPHGEMLWEDYRSFTRLLKPGDFLLTRSKPFAGSNAAIPGAFKHLMVYTGSINGDFNRKTHFIENARSLGLETARIEAVARNIHARTVTHAISEGVVCQDLGEALMHVDYALAVRPWGCPSEQSAIVRYALDSVGKPYDFGFDAGTDKALYCTELGLHCLKRAAIIEPQAVKLRVSPWPWVAKKDVVLADWYIKYPVVTASESCLDPRFQNKSELGGAFQSAIADAWTKRNS